jgi:hypothetical protein
LEKAMIAYLELEDDEVSTKKKEERRGRKI